MTFGYICGATNAIIYEKDLFISKPRVDFNCL